MSYILAIAVGLGSLALYLSAFFLPEVYRKNDFVWSGVAMFYALVLWVCAGRITGGVLLGQAASVALLGWMGWQVLAMRRSLTPVDQQTRLPDSVRTFADGVKLVQQQATEQVRRQWQRLPLPKVLQQPSPTAPKVLKAAKPPTAPERDRPAAAPQPKTRPAAASPPPVEESIAAAPAASPAGSPPAAASAPAPKSPALPVDAPDASPPAIEPAVASPAPRADIQPASQPEVLELSPAAIDAQSLNAAPSAAPDVPVEPPALIQVILEQPGSAPVEEPPKEAESFTEKGSSDLGPEVEGVAADPIAAVEEPVSSAGSSDSEAVFVAAATAGEAEDALELIAGDRIEQDPVLEPSAAAEQIVDQGAIESVAAGESSPAASDPSVAPSESWDAAWQEATVGEQTSEAAEEETADALEVLLEDWETPEVVAIALPLTLEPTEPVRLERETAAHELEPARSESPDEEPFAPAGWEAESAAQSLAEPDAEPAAEPSAPARPQTSTSSAAVKPAVAPPEELTDEDADWLEQIGLPQPHRHGQP